jgi:hypothetical protein
VAAMRNLAGRRFSATSRYQDSAPWTAGSSQIFNLATANHTYFNRICHAPSKREAVLFHGADLRRSLRHRPRTQQRVRLSATAEGKLTSLRRDGTARVSCGTQDIGTGTYTILAQIVSEKTGLPLDKIDVVLGDTALPPGPLSGGSWTTASVIPAVSQAAQNAMQLVLSVATQGEKSPYAGQNTDALNFGNGRVHLKGKAPPTGVVFGDILKRGNMSAASSPRGSKRLCVSSRAIARRQLWPFHSECRRKTEVDMFKSKAPEKDHSAAANLEEVVGRAVQQQHSVVEHPPGREPMTKPGTGSSIGLPVA